MPHAAHHPSRCARQPLRLTWLTAGLLAIGVDAWPRAAHAAAPKTDATATAAPAAASTPTVGPVAARDPMDVLREKLAAKLGATKAPDTKSPYVVQVVSRSDGAAPVAAARGLARERTAAGSAALRAEKALAGKPAAWSYEGDSGPESWGRLQPEFAKCSSGTRQSPIDIRGGIGVDLEPIRFDYRASGFSVVDTGYTVQVNFGAGNAIEVLGRRYELTQLHFHRPSEERVDGKRFDMSVHLEHRDAEGRLAVVAVPLQRGEASPIVQAVWNNLPLEKGEDLPARVTLDLGSLVPKDPRYYTYMGSQTTPPCTEGVLWMVMQQPVALSMEQIAIFARLYPMNARPLQSAAGRLIKQSN